MSKNPLLKEFVYSFLGNAKYSNNNSLSKEDELILREAFGFLKRWFGKSRKKKDKKRPEEAAWKNQTIGNAAKQLTYAIARIQHKDEIDDRVYYQFIVPALKQIEHKYGIDIIYEEVGLQTITAGPDPIEIGSAYLEKEKIMDMVKQTILDKAPHGVNSQSEYIDILESALGHVDNLLSQESGDDENLAADRELSLSMIERSLKQVPFRIFFAAATR